MSKRRHRKRARREEHAKPSGRRVALLAAVVVLAAGILAAAVLLRGREPGGTGSPPASPTAQGAQAVPITPTAGQDFRRLNGRWLRPDGGYILELRDVKQEGSLKAAYFNPRPINVSRAEWRRSDGKLTIFVELRDVNYPGSTYTLHYDPTSDRLKGTYFQAVQKQTYDIEFVRTER